MSQDESDPPRSPAAIAMATAAGPAVTLPKRFYTAVSTTETEDGFGVALDGRVVKTPRKAPLVVPTRPLAEAIAAEWQAQSERIDPSLMPLTRLANSAIDTVAANAEAVRADLVAYAGSDALCYRSEAPSDLVRRQDAVWNPILDWAQRTFDARFITTAGIIHAAQPAETLAAIGAAAAALSPWRLTPVHVITTLTGSAVLALAVEARALDAASAWSAAHVDEDWQIALWGEDFEAADRRKRRWTDMAAAAQMLETLP
jgi:chaperone required for assembly of F1-ATPase